MKGLSFDLGCWGIKVYIHDTDLQIYKYTSYIEGAKQFFDINELKNCLTLENRHKKTFFGPRNK